MNYGEVCATVGAPPGDYSDGYCLHRGYAFGHKCHWWWLTDDAELFVDFDDHGRAARVWAGPAARVANPSLLAPVRDRLGL
jgi:hypothetical protein